jgi:hypothetical protein
MSAVTFATDAEWAETVDDLAADDPLWALRRMADCLTPERLDACALAEPAAALVHAYDLLTPERRAWCEAITGKARFVPDRLEPERRKLIARREGRA